MAADLFPSDLVLKPLSRKPLRLSPATVEEVMRPCVPTPPVRRDRRFRRVSLVVVTHNNLVCNRLCLASVLTHTGYPNYEIVVVDNASTDGTVEFLQALSQAHPHVRILANATNRGFAAANNQGLGVATGDVLVLLNNDTIVPPGWLDTLLRYLKDPSTGAVGPVTNRCGNEAEVDSSYETYGAFLAFAQEQAQQNTGRHFDIPMLTMFCMALRRDTYERLGPLDERFLVGMFEDDDYSLRLRTEGYRLVCAEDVFVHHFGGASFGTLADRGDYGALFHANRQRFERKWNRSWKPHARRRSTTYRDCLSQIRDIVREVLPLDATVAVISKGDEALLELDGREAWHFPQSAEGTFAGYHPADSDEVINQVEAVRARGATHLLVPQTAFWWLDYYAGFREHLNARYQVSVPDEDACLIVTFHPPMS